MGIARTPKRDSYSGSEADEVVQIITKCNIQIASMKQ